MDTRMTNNQLKALRLLDVYTAGHFDFWMLAGPVRASSRAHIMSELAGVRVPQSKAGITALREAFVRLSGVAGDCHAVQDNNFAVWAHAQLMAHQPPIASAAIPVRDDNRITDPHSPMCGSPAY